MASQFILGNPQLEVYTNESALIGRTSHLSSAGIERSQPRREKISARELEIIGSSGLVSPLFKARNGEPLYLSLDFDNGTLCDLHDVNRSVVVDLFCGLR